MGSTTKKSRAGSSTKRPAAVLANITNQINNRGGGEKPPTHHGPRMLSIKANSKHNSTTDVDEKACCANPKHDQHKLFTAKDVLALTNSKTLVEILTQFVK